MNVSTTESYEQKDLLFQQGDLARQRKTRLGEDGYNAICLK